MKWRVLGPVEAVLAGERLPITRPQHRAVLAYLLLNANVVVPVEQLVEALWAGAVPASARTQIQVCVSRLRKLTREAGADDTIVSEAGGYRIAVAEQHLDVQLFSSLATAARAHAAAGRHERAATLLRQSLALWRGPALAGAVAAFVAPAAANLHDKRLAAYEELFDVEFALGRHAAAVAPLRELATENPWREKLAAQLMTALAGSGHQAEALQVYERTRRRLADELGVEPGAHLAEAHLLVLRQQLRPNRSAPAAPPTPPADLGGPGGPAQLPASLSSFTGRHQALATLDAMLGRATESGATAVIAIVGTAGVGKTALAIQWAHRVRHMFGGGQLFLDLRGYTPGPPMTAVEALSRCLRAFGVAPQRVPDDIDEAASLLRSKLADKRVLVLLDNARDTAQIQPLLPGGAGCLVIVTSRGRLDGLAARHDAQRLALDVLTEEESAELLTRIIGAPNVVGQHSAITELGRDCARLPLALRIAAAHLHNHPHQTIDRYLVRLREGDPLRILAVRDEEHFAVRSAFAASYQVLPPELQRLFRLFGLVPGGEVTAESAAVMLRCEPDDAAEMLSALAGAHLVQERTAGRFAPHDLLGRYAAEFATTEESRATLCDFLSWVVSAVDCAADRLYPQVLRLPRTVPPPQSPPRHFAGHVDALAWLDAERHNLVMAVRHAAHLGLQGFAWSLADALRGYFWLGMHTTEWAEVTTIGLSAAEAEGHHAAEAAAHLSLGALKWRLEQFPEAVEQYQLALRSARLASWAEGQAAALGNLGPVFRMSGRPQEALRVLEEALALNRRTGRVEGVAVNHNNLGLVCSDLGRLDEAIEHYHAALALARQNNSVASQGLALNNLGQAHYLLGRCDDALRTLNEALRLHEQTGSRGRAATLCALARVHADRGDLPHATGLAQQALAMARDPAEPRLEATALHTLGIIGRDIGVLMEALAHARKADDRHLEADILISLAELDEPAAALSWCLEALSIARHCGYAALEARALTAHAAVRPPVTGRTKQR